MPSDSPSGDSERVDFFQLSEAFQGEELERDGIIAEVEHVSTASEDPRDDDLRVTFEVRARYVDTGSSQGGKE